MPTRRSTEIQGDQPTNYRLNIIGQNGSSPTGTGSTEAGAQRGHPVSTSVHTQDTVERDTDNVERSNVEKTPDNDSIGSFLLSGKLSPAAQTVYDAYKRAQATGRTAGGSDLPSHPPTTTGLTDEQIGMAYGLAEEMAEVLGGAERNAGYYRRLALDAYRQGYVELLRQSLSDTKAGDVPRGTVGSRSAYFTKILRAKAETQRVALPIKGAPSTPRR